MPKLLGRLFGKLLGNKKSDLINDVSSVKNEGRASEDRAAHNKRHGNTPVSPATSKGTHTTQLELAGLRLHKCLCSPNGPQVEISDESDASSTAGQTGVVAKPTQAASLFRADPSYSAVTSSQALSGPSSLPAAADALAAATGSLLARASWRHSKSLSPQFTRRLSTSRIPSVTDPNPTAINSARRLRSAPTGNAEIEAAGSHATQNTLSRNSFDHTMHPSARYQDSRIPLPYQDRARVHPSHAAATLPHPAPPPAAVNHSGSSLPSILPSGERRGPEPIMPAFPPNRTTQPTNPGSSRPTVQSTRQAPPDHNLMQHALHSTAAQVSSRALAPEGAKRNLMQRTLDKAAAHLTARTFSSEGKRKTIAPTTTVSAMSPGMMAQSRRDLTTFNTTENTIPPPPMRHASPPDVGWVSGTVLEGLQHPSGRGQAGQDVSGRDQFRDSKSTAVWSDAAWTDVPTGPAGNTSRTQQMPGATPDTLNITDQQQAEEVADSAGEDKVLYETDSTQPPTNTRNSETWRLRSTPVQLTPMQLAMRALEDTAAAISQTAMLLNVRVNPQLPPIQSPSKFSERDQAIRQTPLKCSSSDSSDIASAIVVLGPIPDEPSTITFLHPSSPLSMPFSTFSPLASPYRPSSTSSPTVFMPMLPRICTQRLPSPRLVRYPSTSTEMLSPDAADRTFFRSHSLPSQHTPRDAPISYYLRSSLLPATADTIGPEPSTATSSYVLLPFPPTVAPGLRGRETPRAWSLPSPQGAQGEYGCATPSSLMAPTGQDGPSNMLLTLNHFVGSQAGGVQQGEVEQASVVLGVRSHAGSGVTRTVGSEVDGLQWEAPSPDSTAMQGMHMSVRDTSGTATTSDGWANFTATSFTANELATAFSSGIVLKSDLRQLPTAPSAPVRVEDMSHAATLNTDSSRNLSSLYLSCSDSQGGAKSSDTPLGTSYGSVPPPLPSPSPLRPKVPGQASNQEHNYHFSSNAFPQPNPANPSRFDPFEIHSRSAVQSDVASSVAPMGPRTPSDYNSQESDSFIINPNNPPRHRAQSLRYSLSQPPASSSDRHPLHHNDQPSAPIPPGQSYSSSSTANADHKAVTGLTSTTPSHPSTGQMRSVAVSRTSQLAGADRTPTTPGLSNAAITPTSQGTKSEEPFPSNQASAGSVTPPPTNTSRPSLPTSGVTGADVALSERFLRLANRVQGILDASQDAPHRLPQVPEMHQLPQSSISEVPQPRVSQRHSMPVTPGTATSSASELRKLTPMEVQRLLALLFQKGAPSPGPVNGYHPEVDMLLSDNPPPTVSQSFQSSGDFTLRNSLMLRYLRHQSEQAWVEGGQADGATETPHHGQSSSLGTPVDGQSSIGSLAYISPRHLTNRLLTQPPQSGDTSADPFSPSSVAYSQPGSRRFSEKYRIVNIMDFSIQIHADSAESSRAGPVSYTLSQSPSHASGAAPSGGSGYMQKWLHVRGAEPVQAPSVPSAQSERTGLSARESTSGADIALFPRLAGRLRSR